MARFLRLSKFFINVDHIQLIELSSDLSIASIIWFPGYEETLLKDEDASILIAILDQIAIHAPQISITNDSNSDEDIADLLDFEQKLGGES